MAWLLQPQSLASKSQGYGWLGHHHSRSNIPDLRVSKVSGFVRKAKNISHNGLVSTLSTAPEISSLDAKICGLMQVSARYTSSGTRTASLTILSTAW
jgi:hypothetical protein